MVSITIPLSDDFKNEITRFSWVNWSEIAREELMKKVIFEDYFKTGTISEQDAEFCEKMDWHPVDELSLKKEFVQKLEYARKERSRTFNSVSGLFK